MSTLRENIGKCDVGSWIDSWNRKRAVEEKLVKFNSVCSIVNCIVAILIFQIWKLHWLYKIFILEEPEKE